jgi:hypothetical protein
MIQFNEFKESIIETFTEYDSEYFLDEGEYLWTEEIERLKSVTNFTDMSKILVDCEYWEYSDSILYSRDVTEN